mgnify:CR=1 FL=1
MHHTIYQTYYPYPDQVNMLFRFSPSLTKCHTLRNPSTRSQYHISLRSFDSQLQDTVEPYQILSVEEMFQRVRFQTDPILIDARDSRDFQVGRVWNSLNIPYNTVLKEDIIDIPQDQDIYIWSYGFCSFCLFCVLIFLSLLVLMF